MWDLPGPGIEPVSPALPPGKSSSFNLKLFIPERTMRYHYTPLEWIKSKALVTPNANKNVEQQELSFIAGGNA